MSDKQDVVDVLVEKAKKAEDANDALKYSQAALNAANAIFTALNADANFTTKDAG